MDGGIYSVSVISHSEPVGAAVLGLKDGNVRGVGQGYFWRGSYSQKEDMLRVDVYVYQKKHVTIFAEHDYYAVELRRDKDQPGLIYSGHPEQDPKRAFTLEFTWQRSLA
jgi:hypothetical protein